MVPEIWIKSFDQYMIKFFGVNHIDLGADEDELAYYSNLEPKEAALAYGDDYDLSRVDAGWR